VSVTDGGLKFELMAEPRSPQIAVPVCLSTTATWARPSQHDIGHGHSTARCRTVGCDPELGGRQQELESKLLTYPKESPRAELPTIENVAFSLRERTEMGED
jgi:hypothetical protein